MNLYFNKQTMLGWNININNTVINISCNMQEKAKKQYNDYTVYPVIIVKTSIVVHEQYLISINKLECINVIFTCIHDSLKENIGGSSTLIDL